MGIAEFVRRSGDAGRLVVQPRMGMSDPCVMRAGLVGTKNARATTVGTITVDSYTRVGAVAQAAAELKRRAELNGYPIVSHDTATTRAVLASVHGEDFPVQVRHGSAAPANIFQAMIRAGVHASEGGPVSYCLPYGRVPLLESMRNWSQACEQLARTREHGCEPHLETFGGCMLGQLCPPSELVAISVLEALFFYQHGIRSISVSYAQQTNPEQDREAVLALRRLCGAWLPKVDWHVVVYTYMGMYPTSPDGARGLLREATELATATGAERLIVKTTAEASRIPTIEENVAALEYAADVAAAANLPAPDPTTDSPTYVEARALVDAVVNLGPDIDRALLEAFRRGYLDIPFCLHPDNAGRTRSYIDRHGWLHWAEIGRLPIPASGLDDGRRPLTSLELLDWLGYVRRKFDGTLDGTPPDNYAALSEGR